MSPDPDIEARHAGPGAPPLRPNGLPPAILLGGGSNALSVARSLGRSGVEVYALNEPTAAVRFSRYCRWLPMPEAGEDEAVWARYLLGPASEHLRGAALLACSDAGLVVLARHRDGLAKRFLLDDSDRDAQLLMLDKLGTYRLARAAGVPTPKFWAADDPDLLPELRDELVFPLIVKPRLSHVFERRSGAKFVVAADFDQLTAAFGEVREAGAGALLVELIPGPDDRLCSYYTYLDRGGEPLFHLTKRVIRRYPAGMGGGCYHITDRNPEVRDLALRLLGASSLRGLANVEFKRDDRDGRLKLIECNARFTASNCLLADSGMDLGRFVYRRLVGGPRRPPGDYAAGVRLWDPLRDFKAFLELRRAGRITFPGWLGSILHRQTTPYFRADDPLPSLANLALGVNAVRRMILRRGDPSAPGPDPTGAFPTAEMPRLGCGGNPGGW